MPATAPDEVGPALARWLAPYIAAELAKLESSQGTVARSDYDAATCAQYVTELGTGVLNRARDFFNKLAHDGQASSIEVAQLLSIATPRNIPANLTNSLKQRARTLGLERPWRESESPEGRTVWMNRDGIAERMVEAIDAEHQRRFGP